MCEILVIKGNKTRMRFTKEQIREARSANGDGAGYVIFQRDKTNRSKWEITELEHFHERYSRYTYSKGYDFHGGGGYSTSDFNDYDDDYGWQHSRPPVNLPATQPKITPKHNNAIQRIASKVVSKLSEKKPDQQKKTDREKLRDWLKNNSTEEGFYDAKGLFHRWDEGIEEKGETFRDILDEIALEEECEEYLSKNRNDETINEWGGYLGRDGKTWHFYDDNGEKKSRPATPFEISSNQKKPMQLTLPPAPAAAKPPIGFVAKTTASGGVMYVPEAIAKDEKPEKKKDDKPLFRNANYTPAKAPLVKSDQDAAINDIFEKQKTLVPGQMMIAHFRFSTSGHGETNTQPVLQGDYLVIHNGVLAFKEIRVGWSDTRQFAYLLNEKSKKVASMKPKKEKKMIEELLTKTGGSYSIFIYSFRTKQLYYMKNKSTSFGWAYGRILGSTKSARFPMYYEPEIEEEVVEI